MNSRTGDKIDIGLNVTETEKDPFVIEPVKSYIKKPKTYRRRLPKIGRNELCPCWSGKKYKRCCL